MHTLTCHLKQKKKFKKDQKEKKKRVNIFKERKKKRVNVFLFLKSENSIFSIDTEKKRMTDA